MKRLLLLCLSLFVCLPTFALASEEKVESEFIDLLNVKLQKENTNFRSDSVQVIDSVTFKGKITKVIKQDNPDTEENEQQLDKYSANIIVAFIKYEEVRGDIFTFYNKEFFYYDLDKKEFLAIQNVIENKEADNIFNHYVNDVETNQTMRTELLGVLMVLILVFVPWLICQIQGKRESTFVQF